MKRKPMYIKAIQWADREARELHAALRRLNRHRGKPEGWLSAVLEGGYRAGYHAAKREAKDGE